MGETNIPDTQRAAANREVGRDVLISVSVKNDMVITATYVYNIKGPEHLFYQSALI